MFLSDAPAGRRPGDLVAAALPLPGADAEPVPGRAGLPRVGARQAADRRDRAGRAAAGALLRGGRHRPVLDVPAARGYRYTQDVDPGASRTALPRRPRLRRVPDPPPPLRRPRHGGADDPPARGPRRGRPVAAGPAGSHPAPRAGSSRCRPPPGHGSPACSKAPRQLRLLHLRHDLEPRRPVARPHGRLPGQRPPRHLRALRLGPDPDAALGRHPGPHRQGLPRLGLSRPGSTSCGSATPTPGSRRWCPPTAPARCGWSG